MLVMFKQHLQTLLMHFFLRKIKSKLGSGRGCHLRHWEQQQLRQHPSSIPWKKRKHSPLFKCHHVWRRQTFWGEEKNPPFVSLKQILITFAWTSTQLPDAVKGDEGHRTFAIHSAFLWERPGDQNKVKNVTSTSFMLGYQRCILPLRFFFHQTFFPCLFSGIRCSEGAFW